MFNVYVYVYSTARVVHSTVYSAVCCPAESSHPRSCSYYTSCSLFIMTDDPTVHALLEQEAKHLQLLEQANQKIGQMEQDLANAIQEKVDSNENVDSLWEVVVQLENDKANEIHLLQMVMQELIELQEQQQQQQQEQQQA